MSKGKKKTASQGRKPTAARSNGAHHAPVWSIVGLAAIGVLITAYLTALAWIDGPALLCTEGSGCDVIRQSRWSTFLGLPIALWGFAVYTAIGFMAWRMPARLKRWQRLWSLALIGLAISLYLTAAGIVALDAVCPWCLASLATIATILAVLTRRRPESAPGMPWPRWLALRGGAAIAIVVVLHLWSSDLLTHPDTPRLTALAAHLEDTGVKFYGAWWCPACQEQKRLFRSAAKNLPHVECSTGGRGSPMIQRCRELGIDSYPTWIIDGRRYGGILPPPELARLSGFGWE